MTAPIAADVVLEDIVEVLTAALAERDAAIAGLTTLITEMRADLSAINARFAPEPPRPNHVCLKVAASRTGFSAEWLRQCCISGRVDAHRVGNKWFLNVATLEFSNKSRSGKDRA
jgi:hypothetical protein